MGGGLDRGHILYDQQETGLSLWMETQWNEAEVSDTGFVCGMFMPVPL